MRVGILVLNLFAMIWTATTLFAVHPPGWAWAVLVMGGLTVTVWLWRASASLPQRDAVEQRRIGRLIGLWSAVEGVAIFLAANMLVNLHMTGALGPAIGVIVGLHFLPLARWMPEPIYYATAAALVGVSALALALPGAWPLCVTGSGAAIILWTTVACLLRRADPDGASEGRGRPSPA